MIVYCNEMKNNNDVHVIIGEESELNFSLYGNLTINLNDFIKHINKKKPIQIIITRVSSEEYTSNQLGQLQHMEYHNNMSREFSEYMQNKGERKLDKNTVEQGTYLPEVICPKCNNKGVYIKKGEPALCKTCQQIDKGLNDQKQKEI